MSDDDYRDMVIGHDKHIDTLAHSIESLAVGVGATNKKLEDIIDVISTQNVLMERLSNLEINLKESFDRVHEKYRKIESNQTETGCPMLKLEAEKIKVASKRIEALENSIRWVVRTVGTTILVALIGTIVVIG